MATAIAAGVDPGLAERRRKAAERRLSRVTMFRESSGAAALSGRDLPVDATLAALAHLNARAGVYKESGAFPQEGMDRLRATAYLDILNDISAEDRIAYGRLSPDDAPAGDARDARDGGDAPGRPRTPAPVWAGPTAPATSATAGACRPTTATSPTTTDRTAANPTTANRTAATAAAARGLRRPPAPGGNARPGTEAVWPEPRMAVPARAATVDRSRSRSRWPPSRRRASRGGVRRRQPSRNRPARAAIAVPAAPRRAPADPDRPGVPARHPPRPRRTARRGTRPWGPSTPPCAGPWPPCSPQPLHHPLRHRHQRRRHRDRPRLRQARPARPTARRTAPAPDRAPGPDQSHRHRRPTGRTTRTAADRASRTYGTSRSLQDEDYLLDLRPPAGRSPAVAPARPPTRTGAAPGR